MRCGLWFALGLGLSVWAVDARAWRCGGWIIEEGQTPFEVGQKCGDPESANQRMEWRVVQSIQQQCTVQNVPIVIPLPNGGQRTEFRPQTLCVPVPVSITIPVQVEEWFYSDQGYGNVPKLLRFENGRLVFIENLWNLRNMR